MDPTPTAYEKPSWGAFIQDFYTRFIINGVVTPSMAYLFPVLGPVPTAYEADLWSSLILNLWVKLIMNAILFLSAEYLLPDQTVPSAIGLITGNPLMLILYTRTIFSRQRGWLPQKTSVSETKETQ